MFKSIAVVADHNGEPFKDIVKSTIDKLGAECIFPAYNSDGQDDYPDVYNTAYQLFKDGKVDAMVLLCGTGVGMCMCANKSKGVRCVWANTPEIASFARLHENANALALGVNYTYEGIGKVSMTCTQIKKVVTAFITTPSSTEPRHIRRINKLDSLIK